ncbi:hypothetical protein PMAYCL1PPCAC_14388, partial [Pristionchus mayeri]
RLCIDMNDQKWSCGELNELLIHPQKMMTDFAINPKSAFLELAARSHKMSIIVNQGKLLYHQVSERTFAGVHVNEWPSLSAEIVRRGVERLSL